MAWVGIGFRRELAAWINSRPPEIQCVEITAEHFYESGVEVLRKLGRDYPVFVHGLGLSLGTPGPLDAIALEKFDSVVKVCEPEWISEHGAFTRSDEVDLGHLNPVRPTLETLRVVADHARAVSDACDRPIILENITSYLRLDGELSEPEFLNRLCKEADCGLLLDVTNLFINSRNHSFDPLRWLHALEPRLIVQCHVVGYTQCGPLFHDYHAEAIQSDLLELVHAVLDFAPVQAVTIERDSNFPPLNDLTEELRKLEKALEHHRPY